MNKDTLSILDLHKPDEMSVYEFIKKLQGEQNALCTQMILDAKQGDLDAFKLIVAIQDNKEDTPEIQRQLKKYKKKVEQR